MSDTLVTSGGSSATISVGDVPAGTAVTQETAPEQTGAAGSGTPLGSDVQGQSDAGDSQGSTDNGQSDGKRGRWTPIDEIRQLRQWRREAKQRESTYVSELQQVRQQLDELRQSQDPRNKKTARNPADFWQDPIGHQEQLLEERLGGLEERLLERISMSREMEAQQVAVRQEQESAVEFIRSQPNYAPEDDEDLIDIIESIPNRESLNPSWVAEYAWMKLNQERGIGDKSKARARASTVVGQPPGVGLSGKVWTKEEFDRACDAMEKQGVHADDKLLSELQLAVKEGRVRN